MDQHEAIRQFLSEVASWHRRERVLFVCKDSGQDLDAIKDCIGKASDAKAIVRKSAETLANLLATYKPLWQFVHLMGWNGDAEKAAALWPEVFADLKAMLHDDDAPAGDGDGKYKAPYKKWKPAKKDDPSLTYAAFCIEWNRGKVKASDHIEPRAFSAFVNRQKPKKVKASKRTR